MAKIIICRGYHDGASELRIMVDRIVHWRLVDFNGRYGTEVHLDTGKHVLVEAWPEDIEKAVLNDSDAVHVKRV